jgi:hypothetical protein
LWFIERFNPLESTDIPSSREALVKTSLTIACSVAALMLAPAVFAQWPARPDRNAPKTTDGKLDLTAPTPRTADGKPDFSGVWEPTWMITFRRQTPQPSPTKDSPPVATFGNIGAGFKEGLPLRPWAADLLKQRKEQHSKDNPDAHCLPMGLMQFHLHPQPRKIVQTPDLLLTLYEGNGGIRQIFTDGRSLPKNDPQPWWYGYSVGTWDGDTLVVETTGFRDGGWLDIDGSPLTDAAKMTERYRRVNYGILEIDVTIDDPKAYTKPFTVRVDHRIMPNGELIEFICNENNRDPQHMVGK